MGEISPKAPQKLPVILSPEGVSRMSPTCPAPHDPDGVNSGDVDKIQPVGPAYFLRPPATYFLPGQLAARRVNINPGLCDFTTLYRNSFNPDTAAYSGCPPSPTQR